MEELAVLAGFTGTAILGEMHAFRARDPRADDIGEGMSPLQVDWLVESSPNSKRIIIDVNRWRCEYWQNNNDRCEFKKRIMLAIL